MMMQVSPQAIISCGMELVPGCDQLDKGGVSGTMGIGMDDSSMGITWNRLLLLGKRDGELGKVAPSKNGRAVLPDKEERAICTITTAMWMSISGFDTHPL